MTAQPQALQEAAQLQWPRPKPMGCIQELQRLQVMLQTSQSAR